jgi:hypothetical protein
MNINIFLAWLKGFGRYVHPSPDIPVLLVVDGHSSLHSPIFPEIICEYVVHSTTQLINYNLWTELETVQRVRKFFVVD